ncbi:MAG: Holliday junction branch migration DNA helicase RuvB [Parcubacteria group bacterium]|nr:Holliday junction branch migration DNA helicase RuvB [Parcubacteria group bacterium]MBI2049019.1 Holliday junction branch migration DNA helicase RuvB [Parcubacteria group bacterium]
MGKSADTFLDTTLRPSVWNDYVGQSAVKENLKILLGAARERKQPPEHVLFYGPPGLGKTTLAYLIAKEMGANIRVTSGSAVQKIGDLASILTNLSPGDVLFIDEIHRLGKALEEVLYPAMEQGTLDIILGKGPSARTIQLELPSFTLIAATTRVALLSSPLRSRFSGGVFHLEFYTHDDIKKIIRRSASLLAVPIDDGACEEIAKRSRFTPRTANYLLKRCRDFAQITKGALGREKALETFSLLQIDALGLSGADRKILETIIHKFRGGPVGVNTIATALNEEEATVEEVYEPFLIQLGLLERTSRGRIVTPHAYAHLKTPLPKASPQTKLL